MNKVVVAVLLTYFGFLPARATAADEHRAQIYHTPKERREAGLETKLADRLFFSGIAEIHATSFDRQYRNNIPNAGRDDAASAVQLGFKLKMSEHVESEIILDFDENKTGMALKEAFIELKSGGLGWSAGTQTLPFGAYYSHFITGPLVEFGETRATGLLAGYDYNNVVEFSAVLFNGKARKQNTEQRIEDWVVAAEAKLIGNRLTIGASYLSDLADSDEQLLEDFENEYRKKVSAWSAYAVAKADVGEISVEILQAASAFRELAADTDQPRAWNIEIAYFPTETWQVAARIERSTELPDQPVRRYGISATWLAFDTVTLAFEYLRADYKHGFALDDDGNEIRQQTLFAAQLSLEF